MRYVIYLLIAGNLFAIGIGLLLMLAPERLAGWFGPGARWFSLRRLTKPLDVTRDTERALLRRPAVLGAVLVASAVLILIKGVPLVASVGSADGGRMLAQLFGAVQWPPQLWQTLWASLVAFVALGAVLALGVGALALLDGERLKAVSALANRWVSTRQATRPISVRLVTLDQLLAGRPRLWGGVIALAGLYAVAVLAWFARAVTG
jgi:hypothetical protein